MNLLKKNNKTILMRHVMRMERSKKLCSRKQSMVLSNPKLNLKLRNKAQRPSLQKRS